MTRGVSELRGSDAMSALFNSMGACEPNNSFATHVKFIPCRRHNIFAKQYLPGFHLIPRRRVPTVASRSSFLFLSFCSSSLLPTWWPQSSKLQPPLQAAFFRVPESDNSDLSLNCFVTKKRCPYKQLSSCVHRSPQGRQLHRLGYGNSLTCTDRRAPTGELARHFYQQALIFRQNAEPM